jgi:hypothetical protein
MVMQTVTLSVVSLCQTRYMTHQFSDSETVLLLEQWDEMPVAAKEINQWTASDPVYVLSRVYIHTYMFRMVGQRSAIVRCGVRTHDGIVALFE